MKKNKITNNLLIITLFLSLFLISLSSVNAVNITLNPGDPGGVNSAVSTVANSSDVDNTITLNPGTYNKNTDRNNNITFSNKNLVIQGNGPTGSIIIDAQNSGRLFTITGKNNITFINITFINGNTTNDGGAIYSNNGNLFIKNCQFNNNNATRGGAIFSNTINVNITDSSFNNNTARYYGGAIQFYGGDLATINNGTAYIANSNFNNNRVTELHGGAIQVWHYNCTIINSNFTNNNAQDTGGAIYMYDAANLTVINCKFDNNTAKSGGGITSDSGLGFTNIINSMFTNNKATGNFGGGAIFNVDTVSTIIGSTFINNSAIKGGAISSLTYAYFTNITIINSSFTNNTANYGGGIYINNNPALIIGSNFTSNTQGIYTTNESIFGILFININTTHNDINTTDAGIGFENGTQLNGTDIFIIDSNFINNTQAIYINSVNTTVIGCNIINNTQGIYINSSAVNTTINYNRIFNNTNATGFDLVNNGVNTNANLNWWGDNTPLISGIILDNYFVMNVTNLTSTVINGSARFNYTFGLNTGEASNPSLLPFFVTNVYTNATTGIQQTFDARFNRTVTVDTDMGGQNVTYTFVTDNEVKSISLFVEPTPTNLEVNNPSGRDGETVDLIARLTDQNGDPIAGKLITFHVASMTLTAITDVNGIARVLYTIDADDFTDGQLTFTATFEGDETYLASSATGIITLIEEPEPPTPPTPTPTPENETNETSNISAATAAMKQTGNPITAVLIVLLSSLGFLVRKK